MSIVGLAVLIMAVTMVIVAGFLIPTIIEIRKTVAATREFFTMVETELKPALQDMRRTLTEVEALTLKVADKADHVTSFMEAVGDTGRGLRTINTVIGTVASAAASTSAWLTGARVAGQFVLDRVSKRKGGK